MSRVLTPLALAATFVLAPVAANAAFYESFDYSTGNVAGNNGGSGFTGASGWTTPSGTSATVTSPGLTYTNAGGTLTTGGNAWADADSANSRFSERTFDTTGFGANGSSAWFSFLFNTSSTAANTLYTGFSSTSGNYSTSGFGVKLNLNTHGIVARVSGNEVATGASATGVWTTGETTLVVGRVDFKSGNDDLRLWVNPTLGSAPAEGTEIVKNLASADLGAVPSILNIRGGGSTVITVDEWRMGDSFASVTPIPEPASLLMAGLMGGAAMLRRRRKN